MPLSVFSIPPGEPFLRTLAQSLLAGRLVASFRHADDPLALAGVTIFVPTRRAARALAGEFALALGGRAAILPVIRPLGEGDEASLFRPGDAGDLMPAMDGLERRLILARLVRDWRTRTTVEELRALIGEDIVPPASSSDALWLAGDLGSLLDEAENEGVSFAGLAGLAPDRLADWWRLTLTFLAIVTRHWPDELKARGLVSEAGAKNAWLMAEAERYRQGGSPGPVIIAGTTATAPVAVELMRAVAGLDNGALVLPGLDRDLEPQAFAAIGSGDAVSSHGHPQGGLRKILKGLLLTPEAVEHLAPDAAPGLRAREALVSDALRPAETTDAWGSAADRQLSGALDGLALIEAADEREEALAVACAMRDALSDPDATVALTTPDRNLARRVVAELQRFGIEANDSAGRPLSATAPGTLLALAVEAALSPGDPVALVSLLKHPLTRLGHGAAEARRAARTIEMIALRGSVGIADVARIDEIYRKARAASEAEGARVARPVELIGEADRDLAGDIALRLEDALWPLISLRGAPPEEIDFFAERLTRSLEALAADENGEAAELYAQEAGASLAAFLSNLVACPPTGFAFPPAEFGSVLRALLAGETVRPRGGLSSRAFVWGTLEARLQSVDMMVLGGLNEGTWPAGAKSDAFLSRVMRSEISLDPPERRIGLAAHDFWMCMGTKRVVLARSARAGGAPAIPARWLQRLLTVAGRTGADRMRAEGACYLHHARELDRAPALPPGLPPEPRPPLELRPRRYSVTEVETLIRDPYAVFAKRVLKLEPLPEMMRDPHAADRGNLFHAILAGFVETGIDPKHADAEARLLAIAREKFAAEELPAEIEAVWWPRMETLAEKFIQWERDRDDAVERRIAECRGSVEFSDIGTALTGYADRIDEMRDGTVEIIDFKTGTNPSVKQARTLLAPQLPLEGAMARLGGFGEDSAPQSVSDLLYVRLREREFYEERLPHDGGRSGEAVTAEELADEALAKFRALAAHYRDSKHAFVSRARPFMAGDYSGPYDHLARAREWAIGAEEGGGGE